MGRSDLRHVGKRKFPRFVEKKLPHPDDQEQCEILEIDRYEGQGIMCKKDIECTGARRCSCFGWCEGDANCPDEPKGKTLWRNINREMFNVYLSLVRECSKTQEEF